MNFKLEGIYTIYRESDMSVVHRQKNTIQSNGIDHLLDLFSGNASTYYDNTNTRIEVDDSGSQVFSQTGCESGFPDHGTIDQVEWRWKDASTSTYEADTIRVLQNNASTSAPDYTPFSSISVGTSFDYGDDTSDVTKPSGETWIYEYRLSGSTADTVVTNSQFEGVDFLLRAMTNNLDPNGQGFLDNENAEAIAYDGGTQQAQWGTQSISRPSNSDLEYEFVDNSTSQYNFDQIVVREALGDYRLRDDSTVSNSKSSDAELTFTYTLTIS